jgi:hypothetical protein
MNSIVGACIDGRDVVQITKTTLINNSVLYNVEFYLMPNSYKIYTWIDSYEEDFTKLINLLVSSGSKIIKDEGGFALSGPNIKTMKGNIMLTYWDENPMLETYDNQVIVKCEKSPREIFISEIGFYPIE